MNNHFFRILLVEDSLADARLVQLALAEVEGLQFEVLHLERLSQALEKAGESQFDAVLLDLSLPDSHGLGTLSQIKEAYPATPIIVLSGQQEEEVAIEAVKAGAQDYLVKGFENSYLIFRAIRYAIERQHNEQALRKARDDLERRVDERTAELLHANEKLKAQIIEREQAEERARQHLLQLAHVSRLNTTGQMATEIAHEINQPLTAIASYSDTCLRLLNTPNWEREDLLGALEQISSQAERAGEVVRHLRSFVRKNDTHRSSVDINDLVREIAKLIETEARWHNVVVQLQLVDAIPLVLANRILIQQVLLNFVRNAIDAMSQMGGGPHQLTGGARRLTIVTGVSADGTVEVAVRDTGPGLPVENTEQVFEAFYTTKEDGVGMGLSISDSIIKAHQGRLWAANNETGGCTFTFSLPLTQGGRTADVT